MGIIESLEMHNFMCHKYLTFTFGPQINFIIGEYKASVVLWLVLEPYEFHPPRCSCGG